jgi:hypothetical protein
MYRIMMIAAVALTLSACGSAGSPTQPPLTPAAAAHDGGDTDEPVADPNCRSGWSVANGRCL